MIAFAQGNLLEAGTEALVNTVNTVGVMGKGIALMFKEAFPENTRAYEKACKEGHVQVGRMFVTERRHFIGPRWIINFPTKRHWRHPSKMEWVAEGLDDLKRVILDHRIASIALPPLGSGNGGLFWPDVRSQIEAALSNLTDVNILVFEPTSKYLNVAKRDGVQKLTPARALVAELVRRYSVLGIECTLLEVQKLAYLLERQIEIAGLTNPLNLGFSVNRFGPYADRLRHLLNGLDGSYLHCDRRLSDATPFDVITFDDSKRDVIETYLRSEGKEFRAALDETTRLIDGFESPFGMELLATLDWLVYNEHVPSTVESVRQGLRSWHGEEAAMRKFAIFDDRAVGIALSHLSAVRAAT